MHEEIIYADEVSSFHVVYKLNGSLFINSSLYYRVKASYGQT